MHFLTFFTKFHAVGAAGYETALIGRMHFVGPDQRHGFEHRPIGEYSARHPGTSQQGGPLFKDIPASTSGQTRNRRRNSRVRPHYVPSL